MIRITVFALALFAAPLAFAQQITADHFDMLPKKDPAKEIADAIDRQTWEQRFANDRRDYEMSKQTDALNSIDDSIKLQSLTRGPWPY